MSKDESYYIFFDGIFQKTRLENIVEHLKDNKRIWSARLSTGLFGYPKCKAGNGGPSGDNEVIFAYGEDGLIKLIDLGFITCPICKPEEYSRFWNIIRSSVQRKYEIKTLEEFTNKEVLPFDSRRIDWEKIIPITKKAPDRIYVPPDLKEDEIVKFGNRLLKMGVDIKKTTKIGFYDTDSQKRFTEYEILDFSFYDRLMNSEWFL